MSQKFKIYIASSWRNQHGVEMLTHILRKEGHTVFSWIENNYGENHNHVTQKFSFSDWLESPESDQSFVFDTTAASECNLFIYYAPAGKDAMAELGVAWAKGCKHIIGLYAKGEEHGLMSKMVRHWFDRSIMVLEYIKDPDKFDLHICKHCGIPTLTPDTECYKVKPFLE